MWTLGKGQTMRFLRLRDIKEGLTKALENHPADCVFEVDAPEKILQRLRDKNLDSYPFRYVTKQEREEYLECWRLSELYCPHEGIDRLGIKQ
jgi:hypothetical protein